MLESPSESSSVVTRVRAEDFWRLDEHLACIKGAVDVLVRDYRQQGDGDEAFALALEGLGRSTLSVGYRLIEIMEALEAASAIR